MWMTEIRREAPMSNDHGAIAGGNGGTIRGIGASLKQRIQRLSSGIGRFYDGTIYRLFAPTRWVFGVLEKAQARARSRMTPTTGWVKTAGLWLQIRVLWFGAWAVYWIAFGVIMGPILIVYLGAMLGAFILFVVKPGQYSQWVGGAWIAAILLWSSLGNAKYGWLRSLSRISL
jgi:hypothetical protein